MKASPKRAFSPFLIKSAGRLGHVAPDARLLGPRDPTAAPRRGPGRERGESAGTHTRARARSPQRSRKEPRSESEQPLVKERDMHRQLGNLRRWRRAGHAPARTRGAIPAARRVLGGPHGGNATGGRHWTRARPEALRRQSSSLPWFLPAFDSPRPAGTVFGTQRALWTLTGPNPRPWHLVRSCYSAWALT